MGKEREVQQNVFILLWSDKPGRKAKAATLVGLGKTQQMRFFLFFLAHINQPGIFAFCLFWGLEGVCYFICDTMTFSKKLKNHTKKNRNNKKTNRTDEWKYIFVCCVFVAVVVVISLAFGRNVCKVCNRRQTNFSWLFVSSSFDCLAIANWDFHLSVNTARRNKATYPYPYPWKKRRRVCQWHRKRV